MNFYDIVFYLIIFLISIPFLIRFNRNKIPFNLFPKDWDILIYIKDFFSVSNWRRNDTLETFIDAFRFISHLQILCPHYMALYSGDDLTFTGIDFVLYFLAFFWHDITYTFEWNEIRHLVFERIIEK